VVVCLVEVPEKTQKNKNNNYEIFISGGATFAPYGSDRCFEILEKKIFVCLKKLFENLFYKNEGSEFFGCPLHEMHRVS